MKAFYMSFCFLLLMLLFGCQQEENTKSTNGPSLSDEVNNGQHVGQEVQTDLKQYLKPDQTTAHFLGDGNEFATYTEKTTWLDDHYVGTIVDNGGVTMMTIYKISDDKIEIVYKEPVNTDTPFPNLNEIQSMQPIETYFAKPIEVGKTFGNWKIVQTNQTHETPYKTFENVIVIEETGENYINRKYFVKGIGEIKSEYIMDTDKGEKYIVTSTLESITTNE